MSIHHDEIWSFKIDVAENDFNVFQEFDKFRVSMYNFVYWLYIQSRFFVYSFPLIKFNRFIMQIKMLIIFLYVWRYPGVMAGLQSVSSNSREDITFPFAQLPKENIWNPLSLQAMG